MNLLRLAPRLAWLALLGAIAPAFAQPVQEAVGAEQIRNLVEQQTLQDLEQAAIARGANRVEVVAGTLDSRLQLAACATPLRSLVDLSRPNGRINARVSCGAPEPWSIYVPLEIRVFRDVVLATRPLSRGEVIADPDVTLEERDILASNNPLLLSLDDAIGRQVRRTIGANAPISANAIEMPLLVRRGDRISLSTRAGSITVTAGAEALGDGRSGQRIRVRNLQSERVVDATVTGPGAAEVI